MVLKYLKLVLFLLVFLFDYVHYASGDCILSLKDDFGSPSPVFLQNGVFLAPNSDGAIFVKRSETIQVACPGDRKFILLGNVTTQRNVLEAHCIINSTFRVERWIGVFKDIRCNQPPWFSVEDTRVACYGGSRLYRVGYRIGKAFHQLYEVCFDPNLLTTLYVKHELSPTSAYLQSQGGRRPQFLEGDVFGKVHVSQLYTIKKQKERFGSVLGDSMADTYVSNKQFLTRGHLAPRGDFSLTALQKASFHYINVAPQWIRGNAGDWAALEDAVRRRARTLGANFTVYTGTYGVLTLPDNSGRDQPIYLSADPNNNHIVPVPMYYYKVVYNPKEKSATAFVSINSSFFNKTMIDSLQFCEDVCEENPKYSWLRWRSNDGTHSFCCNYEDFLTKINHLPTLDVTGRRTVRETKRRSFLGWLKSLFY